MSDGLLDASAAAQFIDVPPNELSRLVSNGVIPKTKGKFHPVQLVKKYIEFIRNESQRKITSPTQIEIAKHLDMSDRNLRDVLNKLDIDHRVLPLDNIRIKYIRHLRDQAAGRGGDEQSNLTQARIEEAQIKTARMRIDYSREIGVLISTEEAAEVIESWCRQANQNYIQGAQKLVSEIQSAHKISVDKKLVEDIVSTTAERTKDHAEKLSGDLIGRIEDIPETSS